MTYGRYQNPVDLPRAEDYARRNLLTIEKNFADDDKYTYRMVFAENAYAYIKARQGKYKEALDLCIDGSEKMVIAYGRERFLLHQTILTYNTSQVYEIIGRLDEAERQLRHAIAGDPYYGEYQNDLGNLLAKMHGREIEALEAYAQAIRLCPPYPEARLNRGILYARMGEKGAAAADFLGAADISPRLWLAHMWLGDLHADAERYNDALESYRRALSVEPNNPDLHSNIGLVASALGMVSESVAHYESAIALNPRHAYAHNNLAIQLFFCGKLEEALEHARVACNVLDDPDLKATLSWLSTQIGS